MPALANDWLSGLFLLTKVMPNTKQHLKCCNRPYKLLPYICRPNKLT